MAILHFHGRLRSCLLVAIAVHVCLVNSGVSVRAAPPNGSSADERTKAFDWFGSVGYPDVKPLSFVVASVPREAEPSGQRWPPEVFAGFLDSENAKEFTVFRLDLRSQVVAKSAKNAAPADRSGYTLADLAEYVAFVADALGNDAAKRRDSGISPRFGNPPADSVELFVLSWACWRKGNKRLAADLFGSVVSKYRIAGRPASPHESIKTEIEQREYWRAFQCLDDPKLSRQEMLDRCERFAKMFPGSAELPQIAPYTKTLSRMVVEEKEHAESRARGKPFDKLSKNEQIVELIFQLREQTGYQGDNSSRCNIFGPPEVFLHATPEGNTPAHRLAKFGYDAFPQLIEALDDDRLSRAKEYELHGSHEYILTVGDCAELIVSRITAHPFDEYGCMSRDGKTAEVKAAVKKWYAQVLQRGEKQVLIEMVEDGNYDAAAILAVKYPDAALEPIQFGLAKHADYGGLPARFVACAATIRGDAPVIFLLDRAANGKALDERLAAAHALVERDRPEGAKVLIAEWDRVGERDSLLYSLILSMLDSGSVDAIQSLSAGLRERPLKIRQNVVDAIRTDDRVNSLFGLKRGNRVPAKLAPSPNQAKEKEAIVELLVKSLEDVGQVKGAWTGEFNEKWIRNVRICDVAGRNLNSIDPKRFPFDIKASLDERDRSRLAIINAQLPK